MQIVGTCPMIWDWIGLFLYRKIETMANLNRIKVVPVEQEKTGRWLAEELGKSTCTVSKWCSNSAQPDLKTLDQIARVLNVNVKDLLNDTSNVNQTV